MAYSATLIRGVQSSLRRGLAFLECQEDGFLDARQVFDRLKARWNERLCNQFDYWLGGGVFDKYFHGWRTLLEYKECFAFKWKDAGTYHRLYGFLINPRPDSDPRFQVCVLVCHDRKNDESTDFTILNKINRLRVREEVIQAVRNLFQTTERGTRGASNPTFGAGASLDRRKR
jgi:hypothetical protein